MIRYFALLFTILLNLPSDNVNVIKLGYPPEIFTTSKLGNIFIHNNNLIQKISEKGVILGQYSNLQAGPLHLIDASDPMQILLFYKEFNQIVLLDNKLSQLGNPLLIDHLNFSNVSAICKSKQFAVWMYDQYEHKLIHYGFNPKKIIESINLDKYGLEIGNIDFILEAGNEIYLRESEKCIWIFDQFGKKLNFIDIQTNQQFQLKSNNLIFYKQNQLFSYNTNTASMDTIKVQGFDNFDQARIESNAIFVLNADSITILHLDD